MTTKDALEALMLRHGELSPRLIVDAARAANTPEGEYLHERLTWDNDEAAEKHRLSEARALIRSVRVVYREATDEEKARSVRAYVSVATEPGESRFARTEDALRDPVLQEIVMRDAMRAWQDLKRRYGHIAEFQEVLRQDVAALGASAAA